MNNSERIFRISTGDGCFFKHKAGHRLEDAEVQLYCDVPDFKTSEERDTYEVQPIPKDQYKLHNISVHEALVLFNGSLKETLKGKKVEVQVNAYDENSEVVLNKALKENVLLLKRTLGETQRLLKKIRFKQQKQKHQVRRHIRAGKEETHS